MKKLLALLLFSAPLIFAQAAGTIIVTGVTTVVATTATLTCTLTNQIPALATGVGITCKIGTNCVLAMTANVSVSQGWVGSYQNGSDNITWLVNMPSTGNVTNYQIAANGTLKTGAF
jgi:hypothetical protein